MEIVSVSMVLLSVLFTGNAVWAIKNACTVTR
jgi:hypothetical protein